ncbi:hypothetical protein ADK98_33235 [Streptomyces sp. H036]|nr:hypothetical protein ADK98_33235 [Streptomyces sp. H036]
MCPCRVVSTATVLAAGATAGAAEGVAAGARRVARRLLKNLTTRKTTVLITIHTMVRSGWYSLASARRVSPQ